MLMYLSLDGSQKSRRASRRIVEKLEFHKLEPPTGCLDGAKLNGYEHLDKP